MSRRDEYIRKREIQKSIDLTMDTVLSSLTVTLKKEFGFGQERIRKVLQGIETEMSAIGSGMIGYEDYKAYAESLTGVSIVEYTEGKV